MSTAICGEVALDDKEECIDSVLDTRLDSPKVKVELFDAVIIGVNMFELTAGKQDTDDIFPTPDKQLPADNNNGDDDGILLKVELKHGTD
jgi:hypothetical protein